MSHYYRLSRTEWACTLEVIVALPGNFVQRYPADFVNQCLNQAAADAVVQRWRIAHPDKDLPPIMPHDFEIESLSDFHPSTVGSGYGPFHYRTPIGAVSYITRPTSVLVF
jgi:hypothetical protein